MRSGEITAAREVQRSKLAALALDAYPEAYDEFKQLGLALLFEAREKTA